MKTKIEVQGLQRSFKAMQTMKRNDGISLANSIHQSAVAVSVEADVLVPKDNGDLASTNRVEWNELHGFAAQFSVNFGGPSQISDKNVDYAVIVHERYAEHEPPTTWKYLQLAVQKTRKTCSAIVKGKFMSKDTTVREDGYPFIVGGDKWHG